LSAQGISASKSPRKSPCCTFCLSPKAGHPRSGCPNVTPPVPPSTAGPKRAALKPKTEAHERPASSLDDVTTISVAIAAMHLKPVLAVEDPPTDVEDASEEAQDRTDLPSPITPSSARRSTLRRTDSYEVWSAFVKQYGLNEKHAAHVIPVEADKVGAVEHAAKDKGFAARAVILEGAKIGCLIVGKDREAVDKLRDSFSRKPQQVPSLKVVSASAVLGALAAWAVLALA